MSRKLYLSIISVTFVLWTLALCKLEYTFLTLSSQIQNATSQYDSSMFSVSSLFGNIHVPFTVHLLVISLIVSMVAWLFMNYKELLGLYSKEISATKKKVNETKTKISEETKKND
ncbi:hypothetical protein Q2T76_01480 [Lactobacillus sp. YT155]|uniref:hypothetical protein n=1 Tax=Lactobacillus sp. YT155 TaxID=3060955 RepID=UPI00265DF14B|nr:hypothetical protein [Lactobacillus sp. YT155]MDO1604722.1 hypothetical protein [Lactobacillus sp. YT155]